MLKLRALHADIDGLCLHIEELGLGGDHVSTRHGACVELVLCDFERALVLRSGAVEQIAQRVRGAQIEIGKRKLRLSGQFGVVEIGVVCLREGGVAFHLPTDLAPDVKIPGALELRDVGG